MDPRRGRWRERMHGARLCLLLTPAMCKHHDPLALLEASLESVDLLQLRIKGPGGMSHARELFLWGRRLLKHLASFGSAAPPLVINDRVDVAQCLMGEGLAGVHLGQQDTPPKLARQALGPGALLGLSTHTAAHVVGAEEEHLDYLGFGPVHATDTKGYQHGLGSQAAWVASNGSPLPIFPIGGIDEFNAGELSPIGRAAVCSALLQAEDPGLTAKNIRQALAAH